MPNLGDLAMSQLHGIVAIKERIEKLQGRIDSIAGGGLSPEPGIRFALCPSWNA
jgi:hypothetical protein